MKSYTECTWQSGCDRENTELENTAIETSQNATEKEKKSLENKEQSLVSYEATSSVLIKMYVCKDVFGDSWRRENMGGHVWRNNEKFPEKP